MAERTYVAETTSIASGTAKQIKLGGKVIALFNLDGQFYAIDDACTHRGGPLSEGTINGCDVICPWHSASFNIKTGETGGPPAMYNLATYPVSIEGAQVYIDLP
jgi:3-phenylpropionate/trans-cinnamate dioxygenase ferredoxin subunit